MRIGLNSELSMKTLKTCKIQFVFLLLTAIVLFTATSFAAKNEEETEKQEEVHEFYSKFVESENTNEGVKVTIVKSDKYGDFQDEYVAVDL